MKIFRYGDFWVFRIPGTIQFQYCLTRREAREKRALYVERTKEAS
jgi:hypothetical protein